MTADSACVTKYSTMEETKKLLHVAFNGQTEQEVDEVISALGLESTPFSEIHATQKKHKSTIVKKAIPHGNAFEGIHPIASTAQSTGKVRAPHPGIALLHYVGRSKKDRKMTRRSFCSPQKRLF